MPAPPRHPLVPPEWHAWLHYTTDAPLVERPRQPWEKPHLPNADRHAGQLPPAGPRLPGRQRARATGDYEAWTPGS